MNYKKEFVHEKYVPTDIMDCNRETENVWEWYRFNPLAVIDSIKEMGFRETLFAALWLNGPIFVKQYLEKYSKYMDINGRGIFGHTALIYAIIFSNRECIDYILECGADVNLPMDTIGNATPLAMAIDRPLVVEKLLKRGANTNIKINDKPIRQYLHNEIVYELKKGNNRNDVRMKRLMKTYYLIDTVKPTNEESLEDKPPENLKTCCNII
jgi:hypothetical protein